MQKLEKEVNICKMGLYLCIELGWSSFIEWC